MKTSDHFFFLILILLLSGCTAEQSLHDACREKLSISLQKVISDSVADSSRIEITVVLTDSTGIVQSFPDLSVPNERVALGHLTKEEISALCKHKNVQYIDTPKVRFPNK